MKVEEKSMVIQDKNNGEDTKIVAIPKDPKESPRKAWSLTKRDETKTFRLYV
jgi:hypothetical protein